jgi:hypothetical protein
MMESEDHSDTPFLLPATMPVASVLMPILLANYSPG